MLDIWSYSVGFRLLSILSRVWIKVNNKKTYRWVLRNDKIKANGGPRGLILMDYDTRHELELKHGARYRFKITRITFYTNFLKWVWFYLNHPDRAINIGFKLGSLSILLALFSILLTYCLAKSPE